MSGYEPGFLAVDIELPSPKQDTIELEYTHFTVLLDPARKLAAATAVNIDASSLIDVARASTWHLDERVPDDLQAGPALYRNNSLDRGHMVRRRDPVWGDAAKKANTDTFSYPNAAPQASDFNQSKELWVGLEDHVLEYAEANDLKLSVFTGPVLAPDDALYRGVRVPRLFWKVAAWSAESSAGVVLRSAGFVLDQSPLLGDVDLRDLLGDKPPPLGPFRTFQVPVDEIARLTGLELGPLVEADRYAPVPAAAPGAGRASWRELAALDDTTL